MKHWKYKTIGMISRERFLVITVILFIWLSLIISLLGVILLVFTDYI
jgi:hypothetical protein